LTRRGLQPLARQGLIGALMLVPGGLVVYFGFHAGGFFVSAQDLVGLLLALLLALNLALDRRAMLRRNRPLLVATVLFAAYTGWVLLSLTWSHAPLRADNEFDLALVYFLAFVLYACSATSARRMRWLVRGLALGAFVVCLVALVSRTLPAVWPIPESLDTARLSYPVTYWNALGLLASLGAILCLGLTSDDREPGILKGFSALALPVFAATLLLTFSRGAIAAGIAGVALYILIARSRSLLSALISVVPATAVALHATYEATALAQRVTGNPAAVGQGHTVAIVVAACSAAAAGARWMLVGFDRRLIAITWRSPLSLRARRASSAIAVLLACLVAVAAGLPRFVHNEYNEFVSGEVLPGSALARDRLTQPGADGRLVLWRVAVRQYHAEPLHGSGAGTFALAWETDRPQYEQVLNAHNLYLENLGELGIVGVGLLALVLIAALIAISRRVRGPDRALYAAALALVVAWALHAAVDWDWQMPVVTLPAFALAGAAFARRRPQSASSARPRVRWLLGALALLLAAPPAMAAISGSKLTASLTAFEAGNCAKAESEAHDALDVLWFRPDAHEILAYCELADGERSAALRDITRAVAEDPDDWESHEGLSIVQGASGGDPRAEMARALALDPKYALLSVYDGYFSLRNRRYWRQEAALDLLQVTGQNDYQTLEGLRGARKSS
jgi:O-antigen ligase